MATINLREFYPWYTHDEFVEVPDVIAGELFADRRYQKTHERTLRRNKVHSIDAEDGTEEVASTHLSDNPEVLFAVKEQHCRLCCAINSLPETQARRIEARYILSMSVSEISKAESAGERNIRKSIDRGLISMRKFLINCDKQGTENKSFCPD